MVKIMTENKNEHVVFSVRWPKWLYDEMNRYCNNEERSRNWMIKKIVSQFLGLTSKIGERPDERDDVGQA